MKYLAYLARFVALLFGVAVGVTLLTGVVWVLGWPFVWAVAQFGWLLPSPEWNHAAAGAILFTLLSWTLKALVDFVRGPWLMRHKITRRNL